MLVIGGAPKSGKSDFVLSLLTHMAAGESFLEFKPPHPLRVFVMQAEIQYDYLRERVQNMGLSSRKSDVVNGFKIERGRRISLTFRTVILD